MRVSRYVVAAVLVLLPATAFAQMDTSAGSGPMDTSAGSGPIDTRINTDLGAGGAADSSAPRDVENFVRERSPPRATVGSGSVNVGDELSRDVELRRVPASPQYSYGVVNGERVIVDPHTRQVIEVVR
jgi:hypothetical protein